eukprot:CAMPEP_0181172940 /NCGR_PEP_ID=MMETSP1096-20121128/2721_1 /TAXON_ID=156174 ORGANISM="Chrysochromulina ericina, Strain CCMP281" /NCGR_SAMPLE_ID=MMETSP1096 /ASSEMBLY_ACC=CAM_ASM_000453 /LENGTH=67 /DNA_ID=CAMNT_0023260709 /DNA_START=251 /DNA_END=457 /DNA_ORIENTATION=-
MQEAACSLLHAPPACSLRATRGTTPRAQPKVVPKYAPRIWPPNMALRTEWCSSSPAAHPTRNGPRCK